MPTPAVQDIQARRTLKRAPLVGPAGGLMLGIVVARYLPVHPALWITLAVLGGVALAVSLLRPHLHMLGLLGACILAGGLGGFRTVETFHAIAKDDIARYTSPGRSLATVRGEILTHPRRMRPDVEFGYRPEPRLVFDLQADAVLTGERWTPVSGKMRVTIDEPYSRWQPGQRIELVGWIGRLGSARNPGSHDPAATARLEGIRASLRVPSDDGVTLLESPQEQGWLQHRLATLRTAARAHFTHLDAETPGQVTTALVVGERSPALRRLSRTMTRAGVAHLLSISGLHLAIFCGCVYLLCRTIIRSPRVAAGVVLLALGAYLLTAEPRAALLRGGMMAGALAVAVLLGRRASALNALAIAAIVLLLADPLELLQPGFQLSFTIVTALLLLTPRVQWRLFGGWLKRRGLMVFRDEERWRRWLWYRAGNTATQIISASVVAYLAAAPLVAVWFGLFSPWAILLSLLLLPLVVAVLLPGYVSLSLAWALPGLAASLGALANRFAAALAWTVERLELLPALAVKLQPLGPAWAILCYATLLAILFAPRLPRGKWLAEGLTVLLVVSTLWTQAPVSPPQRAELHVLAVGAGQCAMLRLPAGQSVLIDAGTRSGYDVYRATLEPFLQHGGYPPPRVAIISHPNADHYSALPGLARSGELQRVYVNEDFLREADQPFNPAQRLLNVLDHHDVEVRAVAAGETLKLGAETTAEVIWPPANRTDLSGNDASLVLRVTHAGRTVMLPGDIGQAAMAELLAAAPQTLRADAILLPHHGSWEASLPALLAAVQPQVVVCSNHREPHAPAAADTDVDVFYADLQRDYRYYSTARDGWVRLTFGGGRMDVQTFSGQE
jgi:competence protein ComEC